MFHRVHFSRATWHDIFKSTGHLKFVFKKDSAPKESKWHILPVYIGNPFQLQLDTPKMAHYYVDYSKKNRIFFQSHPFTYQLLLNKHHQAIIFLKINPIGSMGRTINIFTYMKIPYKSTIHVGISSNAGFPQQPGPVFLLNMIIKRGGDWGYIPTIFVGNTQGSVKYTVRLNLWILPMGSIRSHLRFFPTGRGFNDATCSVYATTFLPLMIGVGIVPDFLVIGKTGGGG